MKKSIRLLVFILVSMMIASPLSACNKGGDSNENNKTSASAGKTVSSKPVSSSTSVKSGQVSATAGVTAGQSSSTMNVNEESAQNPDIAADTPGTQAEDTPSTQIDSGGEFASDVVYEGKGAYAGGPGGGKNVDMKGATIKIAASDTRFTRQWVNSGYRPFLDALGKRMDYVEQEYNCKLEFVSSSSSTFQQKLLSNAIAGVYFADMAIITGSTVMKLHGLLQPLDDYLDFKSEYVSRNVGAKQTMVDGKHYVITLEEMYTGSGGGIIDDYYIAYNKDILGREGLPDPFEMQMEKQWTWETMLDIALKATRDINGDGITDQWGIVSDNVGIDAVAPRFVVNNGGQIIVNDNGTYRINLGEEKAIRALQFLVDLQKVHGVLRDLNDIKQNYYKLGFAGMAFATQSNLRADRSVYPQNTGIVVFPMGPDAENYVIYNQFVATFSGAIPLVGIDEPEKIGQILYDLFAVGDDRYPNYLSATNIKDNYPNMFIDENYATLELSKSLISKVDIYTHFSSDLKNFLFTSSTSLFFTILNGNMTVASVVAQKEGIVNDKISSLLGQYKK